MALVEIRGVTKRYQKGGETITPLDEVSLNIEHGEFVSLMGASGTGKSTLLNLVASIDRPDGGSVVIDGTEITRLSRSRLAKWRRLIVDQLPLGRCGEGIDRGVGYVEILGEFVSLHACPLIPPLGGKAICPIVIHCQVAGRGKDQYFQYLRRLGFRFF